MAPLKDESPAPSTMTALVQGLSVAPNPKISGWERFGPAAVGFVWLAATVVLAFNFVPHPDKLETLIAATGPFIGLWIGKLGSSGN